MFRSVLIATALIASPLALSAQSLSDERIKELALQAILENPEIIMQAVEILQQREEETAQAAAENALITSRDMLLNDPNAPVLGNPDGDVTIVEFFDYNCPYCRRAGPQVKAALAADPGIRVVYREWPILGEASVIAARAALAARTQGKYDAFHEALMGAEGRLSEDKIFDTAVDVGLNLDKLRADMQAPDVTAHIEGSMQLAQALGFNGTPAFVIGEMLAPGLLDTDAILDAVSETRASN